MDYNGPWAFQYLRATNDPSGNPRRCFVVYAHSGHVLEVIDEGYGGKPARLRHLVELPSFDVSAMEYKDWVKLDAQA